MHRPQFPGRPAGPGPYQDARSTWEITKPARTARPPPARVGSTQSEPEAYSRSASAPHRSAGPDAAPPVAEAAPQVTRSPWQLRHRAHTWVRQPTRLRQAAALAERLLGAGSADLRLRVNSARRSADSMPSRLLRCDRKLPDLSRGDHNPSFRGRTVGAIPGRSVRTDSNRQRVLQMC